MSDKKLKRAADPDVRDSKHPFGQLQRHATRNEVVNAASAIGKQVYDQIAEEHEQAIAGIYTDFDEAMTKLYDEFNQYREVSARQIRSLQQNSMSFQIVRALRTDFFRAKTRVQLLAALAYGYLIELGILPVPKPVAETLEDLAAEAERVAADSGVDLGTIEEVEKLHAMMNERAKVNDAAIGVDDAAPAQG